MLTIRLSRVGKKKQPSYRILVQERKRSLGTFIENIGHYNFGQSGQTYDKRTAWNTGSKWRASFRHAQQFIHK